MKQCSIAGESRIGGRSENQDAMKILKGEDSVTVVLADGLGGEKNGKQAAEEAVALLAAQDCSGALPSEEELADLFDSVNDTICSRKNIGKTTAVYLTVCDKQAIWAHIGDSRLYHLYNGRLVDYTMDHSLAQMAVFLEDIEREEMASYPGRSRLSKALGVAGEHADIKEPQNLEKGRHVFLLCTDGLWESISEQTILDIAARCADANTAVRELFYEQDQAAGETGDNTTIAVVVWEV